MIDQIDISKALTIDGWMSEKELIWLATQAKKYDKIVEFGCLNGRSTRALADNTNGKIWAVDPWAGDSYYIVDNGSTIKTDVMPVFIGNLEDHIHYGKVIVIKDYSYNLILPVKVDMVFLDGDHSYSTVMRDINKAIELTQGSGLICGHDYNHSLFPGVKEAVDTFFGEIEITETIWSKVIKS